MGRYSGTYSYAQMKEMGFIKPADIPAKYKTSQAVFWFAYYGRRYVDEIAEIHARKKVNVGRPVTLKTFGVRSRGNNKKLFIKAIQLEQ